MMSGDDGAIADVRSLLPRPPSIIQAAVTRALFKSYLPSEVLSYLRIIERPDAHSIRFRAQDMAEAADFIQFLEEYNITLEP